ncbi:MAG: hypothetical protein QOJ29_4949, partial [Thermoleophilaceae bacterium]|nr:hypothetical protein [Thermoleophilaceae bacterium]
RTYSFPTCNVPNAYSSKSDGPYGPASPPEYMGISAGWGDVYTWDLPNQYIDITTVPDGTYQVVSRSNPDGGILSADRRAETGITCIQIKGAAVKTIKELVSQPNYAQLPNCWDPPRPAKKHKTRKRREHRHHAKHRRHHR